jgi:Cathepsin propeptide inhibitor domain (I29)
MSTESDVSIPYDAAARLAYDEWCNTYGKPFDASRYETFKENYAAITVMNVSTKKMARDSGEVNPSLLALNEYADYTAEEYEAAMNGEEVPATTGDVLGKVVEAAQSQSAASNALQEAAEALADEEEVGQSVVGGIC